MGVHNLTLEEFAGVMRNIDETIEKALVRGLRSSGRRLQGLTVEEIQNADPYPAVDRGELANSIEYFKEPDGSSVAATAPHAAPIEDGTRPFTPPLRPLYEWVLRKKITDDDDAAWAIAKAVQKKFQSQGIAPRHYFKKAFDRMIPQLVKEVERELDNI